MADGFQMFSLVDAAEILAQASPADRAELTRARDGLTELHAMGLLTSEPGERVKAARDALDRILAGECADSRAVLDGAGEAIAQALRLSEEAVATPAPGPELSATPTLPPDADSELLAEYIVESIDHITAAEAALLELEINPKDEEALNTVFRAFHTIKGTSGFLGLDHCQEMAHKAENILHRAREGEILLTGGYADLSLEACDVLKVLIQGLKGLQPGDAFALPPAYESLLAMLLDPEKAGVGEEVETVRPPSRVGDLLVAEGKVTREEVDAVAGEAPDGLIGEKLIRQGAVKPGDVAKALRTQKQIQRGGASDATIRVATTRLDSLINMVGELVIAHSMVAQDPTVLDGTRPQLAKSVSHASKIVRDLQDLTMGLRMVPLKGTFQKMARLVRDLSRKSGKSVQFFTEGEDTEIDRNMVEVLNDPLVHMIRNSLDHGLEKPEERLAQHKPESGTVTLRAYHTAGNVVLELTDDGRGLDKEKIRTKAVERGLAQPDAVLTDNEVFGLIFQAGFSTAEKVTDVSGRGVGMDVVRTSIEALRGRLQINSEQGLGTTITLHLPLTMAITDAMLVSVGKERYLMPTVSIEQSFRPDPETLSTVEGRGEIVMLRGELVPIVRLADLFGVQGAISEPAEGLLIAVEAEGKRCALMVDELLGQHQVVVKTLGEGLGEIPGVSGGTILGDGRVGLILDVASLLKIAHAGALIKTGKGAAAPQQARRSSSNAGASHGRPELAASTT